MKTFALTIVALAAVSSALAQETELNVHDVTEKMQRRYEMIDDASAEFVKHVKLGFSNIEQTYAGSLFIKKPSKFRIEAENETIVTDGVTVWLYSPVNNQVIVDNYKESHNSISPENFLLNLPQNYYATLLASEKAAKGTTLVLKLVPKDDRAFVKTAKVFIDAGTWVVRRITILDVNDSETTYTIKDIKLNTNLSDKKFLYTPPAGVEVVDLR